MGTEPAHPKELISRCQGVGCAGRPGFMKRYFFLVDRPDVGSEGTVYSCDHCTRLHILQPDGTLKPS